MSGRIRPNNGVNRRSGKACIMKTSPPINVSALHWLTANGGRKRSPRMRFEWKHFKVSGECNYKRIKSPQGGVCGFFRGTAMATAKCFCRRIKTKSLNPEQNKKCRRKGEILLFGEKKALGTFAKSPSPALKVTNRSREIFELVRSIYIYYYSNCANSPGAVRYEWCLRDGMTTLIT